MRYTTKDKVRTAERRNFVFDLRKMGTDYRTISAEAIKHFGVDRLPSGWDERYAYKDIKRELRRLNRETAEDAKEVVRLELARLDMVLKEMTEQVKNGSTDKIKQGAADRVIRIGARRTELLGVDAPKHIKIDDWRTDLIQLIRENQMSYSQLVEQFGNAELADELFLEAGVNANASVINEEDVIDAEFVEAETE